MQFLRRKNKNWKIEFEYLHLKLRYYVISMIFSQDTQESFTKFYRETRNSLRNRSDSYIFQFSSLIVSFGKIESSKKFIAKSSKIVEKHEDVETLLLKYAIFLLRPTTLESLMTVVVQLNKISL